MPRLNFHTEFKKTQKGFTLIELLVVIAIIALLASTILVSAVTARSRARDAKRKDTLAQLHTAIQLYNQDTGSYPGNPGTTVFTSDVSFCSDMAPYVANACQGFKDPQSGSYAFLRLTSGQYYVGARFEYPDNQVGASMYWAGGGGEPNGLFYLYGPYRE